MAQSQWFLLAGIAEIHQVADGTDDLGQLRFAMRLEKPFQFRRGIEMVLDRILATSRHDHDVFDARSDAFLDDVLNQGFVDDGKHLFGLGLGGRQESRTQARCGQYSFAHSFGGFWHGRSLWRIFRFGMKRLLRAREANGRFKKTIRGDCRECQSREFPAFPKVGFRGRSNSQRSCYDELRKCLGPMTTRILGIESSCDETAASVVADGREILSICGRFADRYSPQVWRRRSGASLAGAFAEYCPQSFVRRWHRRAWV